MITRRLTQICLLFLTAAPLQAQQWTTNTLPPGLIAWWQADGNYLDSAGAHHGSSGATFGPGRFGQAFQLNGINQSVGIPDASGDLNDWTQFTLEAWVKLDKTADVSGGAPGRSIINRVGNASDQVNFNQGYQFGFAYNATWIFLAFNTNGQAWPGVYTTVTYPAPLPTNVWLHVAATYDQNAVKLYLNGVPQVTNVIGAVTVRHSTSAFRIGRDDNGNCPFPGSIDDVRVYSRGLTATEISRLALSIPGANGVWGLKTHDPNSQPPTTMFYFDENGANYLELGRVTLAGAEIEADGLAMPPAGGLFVFQVDAAGGSRLLALNSTTAVASVVGPVLPGRNVRGATFTLSGRLLAFDFAAKELIEVSPASGLEIGPAVPLSANLALIHTGGDLTQMPDGSLLFAYNEFVYRLDPRTGTLVPIYEDKAPLLDGNIPFCCGIACAPGSAPANKVFGYEATMYDDVYQYLPSSGFARTQLYNNVVPSYNAGRGDLAALPAARVELLDFSVINGTATLQTVCRGGAGAAVEFTDDLAYPNWQEVPGSFAWIPLTSGTIATPKTWRNLPADAPHRFYRVRIQ